MLKSSIVKNVKSVGLALILGAGILYSNSYFNRPEEVQVQVQEPDYAHIYLDRHFNKSANIDQTEFKKELTLKKGEKFEVLLEALVKEGKIKEHGVYINGKLAEVDRIWQYSPILPVIFRIQREFDTNGKFYKLGDNTFEYVVTGGNGEILRDKALLKIHK